MASSERRPRHPASSPFQSDPEPTIEVFEVGDLVSHDSYRMGRVIQVEESAVSVDFRPQRIRVMSPFRKMSRI
ncbi:hypothetical protein [Nocardioides flavescens]|uniref:Uncharacterized protein n=1 Tax=Nocardioides flavescens TaxID=2691959 RepID=A0A6L7F265_9ACTN|nr:hypothetical protein [Nocardioides flavescens]MXG91221.1 hypothetical protein [Nocardioides flavescens]